MKIYYLLDVGDIVEDGDEEYSENEIFMKQDCPQPQWRPVTVEFIGEAVQEIDPPVRRKCK